MEPLKDGFSSGLEMVEDPADRDAVGDVGHDLERATAAFADERIRLKDLGDAARRA